MQCLLKEKGISRYTLSKQSGVPWATLADIYAGKTDMKRCNVGTLSKLATALDLSIEELLKIETGVLDDKKQLFEKGLPKNLQQAIDELEQGRKDHVLYVDCLWGELYGSINADFWSGIITKEQADFLRNKYLY